MGRNERNIDEDVERDGQGMKDGERGRRVETTMNNCRRARGRSDVIDGSLQEAEKG